VFSIFKRKQKPFEFPPLPDDIHEMMRGTARWCRGQIGDFLGESVPQDLPDYGLNEDVMIGSYLCGFTQGQLLVNGKLTRWAKGDSGLYTLGFTALVMPAIAEVLGDLDRSIAACQYLPQLGPADGGIGIDQIDRMGGADGMAHAKGEGKQHGGLLRFYLENNVAR
jgi:hypothetical protein